MNIISFRGAVTKVAVIAAISAIATGLAMADNVTFDSYPSGQLGTQGEPWNYSYFQLSSAAALGAGQGIQFNGGTGMYLPSTYTGSVAAIGSGQTVSIGTDFQFVVGENPSSNSTFQGLSLGSSSESLDFDLGRETDGSYSLFLYDTKTNYFDPGIALSAASLGLASGNSSDWLSLQVSLTGAGTDTIDYTVSMFDLGASGALTPLLLGTLTGTGTDTTSGFFTGASALSGGYYNENVAGANVTTLNEDNFSLASNVAAAPEPGTYAMLLLGLMTLVFKIRGGFGRKLS